MVHYVISLTQFLYLHTCAITKFYVSSAPQNNWTLSMAFRILHRWGLHKTARPGRDVFLALALKGALLLTVYLLFFSPAHRLPSDATTTATALIGTSASKDAP